MAWGGKRENAGRKAPDGFRKPHQIRFSDDEWEKVNQYAKELNITPSEYIRRMALKEIEDAAE